MSKKREESRDIWETVMDAAPQVVLGAIGGAAGNSIAKKMTRKKVKTKTFGEEVEPSRKMERFNKDRGRAILSEPDNYQPAGRTAHGIGKGYLRDADDIRRVRVGNAAARVLGPAAGSSIGVIAANEYEDRRRRK